MLFSGSIWHSIKKAVTSSTKDEKEKEHKEQFTTLVRELGAALRGHHMVLTLSILPHVNAKGYYEGLILFSSLIPISDVLTVWFTYL